MPLNNLKFWEVRHCIIGKIQRLKTKVYNLFGHIYHIFYDTYNLKTVLAWAKKIMISISLMPPLPSFPDSEVVHQMSSLLEQSNKLGGACALCTHWRSLGSQMSQKVSWFGCCFRKIIKTRTKSYQTCIHSLRIMLVYTQVNSRIC